MTKSLCTFTPEGSGAVALGTEDCWVEVVPERGQITYIVHSNYVDRQGNPFYIEGSTRARAEEYAGGLSEEMGHAVSLRQYDSSFGMVSIPPLYAVPGTLYNPFTGLSQEGLYFIGIEHTDRGGRYYGMTIRFSKPVILPSSIPEGGLIQFKGVSIGNLPGQWNESPDSNFLAIQVTAAYWGDNSKYLSDLANLVGYEPVFKAPVLRGLPGNRGVIKGYHAVPGSLVWNTTTYEEVFITSLGGRRDAAGLLEIQATFEVAR